MKKYLALFLVLSSLGLVGCGKAPVEKEKPIAVSVQAAKNGGIENTNTFTGITKVKEETAVTLETAGKVEEIYASLGQQVKKGDKLLRINGEDAENSVKQQQAALDIAKANYTNSKTSSEDNLKSAQRSYDETKRTHDINTQLYQAGALTEDAYKKSEVALNQAKQTLDMAQKTYDAAKSGNASDLENVAEKQLNQAQVAYDIAVGNLNKLVLTAPVDGIITTKNFNVAEQANQQKPAFIISSPNTLQVDLNVTQADLSKFSVGQEVDVTVNGKKIKGTVKYVPEVVESSTSLYDVQILIDNSENDLKAGMSAEVEVSIEKQDKAVTIPKKAVFKDNEKSYVYIANSDNMAVKTEVATGIETATTIEIKSGVSQDDTVVIGGLNLISDGSLIFPVTKED
jgi:multidrug efflux pump subunit AcrA (membrane-fusion protein)